MIKRAAISCLRQGCPVLVLLVMLTACTNAPRDAEGRQQGTTVPVIDRSAPVPKTTTGNGNEPDPAYLAFIDSLSSLVFDTTTPEGCRSAVMNRYLIENGGREPIYDSLLDLNYDRTDDYVLGWYGLAGTGLKYGWDVYLWNQKRRSYEHDTILSGIPNPSFFSKERMVTSFYLPHGIGHGEKMEWHNGAWLTTMEFMVDNNEEKSVWLLTDPKTGRVDSIKHPYEFVPPQQILRHHYVNE